MRYIYTFIIINVFLITSGKVYSQEPDSVWSKLKPFFSPPGEYSGDFGAYRSPLKFYDGRQVKTPRDWKKRRKEILVRWQNMLGHWPELIAKPSFEVTDSIHQENFTNCHIRFSWRAGETTSAYLLVPDASGKKPAVVIVYYDPETAVGLPNKHHDFKPDRDIGLQLARRGFVVLSIGTAPEAREKPYAQYYPNYDSATVQPLSMLGYLAANAYQLLAGLPYVRADRIGITGHSYGGKWAMFASCLYEKFACAVWSDPGIVFDESDPNVNYYDPWYLGYYPPPWSETTSRDKGLYPKLRKEGYDLHELHALMAPRPFLVSGGSEDQLKRWIPLNHAIAVNRLLGFENRVGMTNRAGHPPTAVSNEQICLFFEHYLKYNGLNRVNEFFQSFKY
jgi:dienelactone hydrolase